MNQTSEIVDRGRGPQLSTSRITVQDLVPYLQEKFTHEQLREIMPVLTEADIQTVERYIQDNYAAVMEQDRRIRERNAERLREHRARFPEPPGTLEERKARLLELLEKRRREKNGARHPG